MNHKLICQISETLQNVPNDEKNYLLDLEIICYDGIAYWNTALIASLSSNLEEILKENTLEEYCLVLPDFDKSLVNSFLTKSVSIDLQNDAISDEFRELIKAFNGYDLDKTRNSQEGPSFENENNNEYNCTFEGCSAKFSRRLHLERHQSIHIQNPQNRKLCDLCGKVFFHEDNLRLHMAYHKDIEKNYHCDLCNRIFKGRRVYQNHMKDIHSNKVSCPLCKKMIKKRFLPRHVRNKHNSQLKTEIKRKEAKIKPINQDESLISNDANANDAVEELISHQKKRIKCPNCDKTFSNQYNAKYHNERVHLKIEQQASLSCSVCEKKFKGPPSRLARHLREVHAENRFECSECGHFFPVKASLVSRTDLGSLIGNTQCGNFRIFLTLRFTVKSIVVILKP